MPARLASAQAHMHCMGRRAGDSEDAQEVPFNGGQRSTGRRRSSRMRSASVRVSTSMLAAESVAPAVFFASDAAPDSADPMPWFLRHRPTVYVAEAHARPRAARLIHRCSDARWSLRVAS